MNVLQKALVKAGLAQPVEEKVQKPRKFKCRACGGDMITIPYTNTMSCTNAKCKNYYIFSNTKNSNDVKAEG